MATTLQHEVPENELRQRVSRWLSDVSRRESTLKQLLDPLPQLDGLRPFSL